MIDVRAYKVRMTQMHALPRKRCLKQPFTSGLICFEYADFVINDVNHVYNL